MGCFASKPVGKTEAASVYLVRRCESIGHSFPTRTSSNVTCIIVQAVAATSVPDAVAKPPLPVRQPKAVSLAEQQGLKGPIIDDSAHEEVPACETQAMLLLTLPLEEAVTEMYKELGGNLTGASLNLTLSCEEDSQKGAID